MMTLLTLLIAAFTMLVFLVYERIEWLTGAMETHSELMLRIEAKRGIKNGEPIDLVWWDPTIEERPAVAKHGEEVKLDRIYVYMPPELRQVRPTWRSRFNRIWTQAKHGPSF